MTSRNLFWHANGGMTAPSGKPQWPALLTIRLNRYQAWDVAQTILRQLSNQEHDGTVEREPIDVFIGGGDFDPDES